ncbi:hypothetical protein [Methanosarcina sp. DH2]|uniref:hypothetical protein n=1 Tax=Methanosarcina sp. DH2 TaxID=2605639 RepID=UPI001E458913|nr:hypothetical protein [Methanosarcina sp. DH2]
MMTVLIQKDLNEIIMEKTGINEGQLKKMEKLLEENLGGAIDQNFSMSIKNGTGAYDYSKTSWGVTIDGYAVITAPDNGTWHLVAKDGDKVVFDKQGVTKDQQVSFSCHSGFKLNLTVTATWSEKKDTTLNGRIHAKY